jgi:hypothetical protein
MMRAARDVRVRALAVPLPPPTDQISPSLRVDVPLLNTDQLLLLLLLRAQVIMVRSCVSPQH